MITLATPTHSKPPQLCTSQIEKKRKHRAAQPLPCLALLVLLVLLTGSTLGFAQTRPATQTSPRQAQAKALPRVTLNLSSANNAQAITVYAELANTDSSRKTGLMGRKQLPAGQGMVFDFKTDAIQCMWMKNTLIALDVGFFDAQGRLVNVATMQPETQTIHCSASPIRYALEVPAGWFAAQSLEAGAILHTPFQPSPGTPWVVE